MNKLSVVIITRNEEHNIAGCIQSARLVSDDIIVVDSGSDDNTTALASQYGANVFTVNWEGYGASRNFGAGKAKNNWILALDADERISEELAASVRRLTFSDDNCIYRFERKNYLANKKIRFGTLGFETVKRIYNRNYACWDLTLVHEKLVTDHPTKKKIKGFINHFGLRDKDDYKTKAVLYAQMSAQKYLSQGKKNGLLKRFLSPLFNSVKSYVFQLGFLDGRQGWTIAKTIAYYSWLKYYYLHQLLKEAKTREISFPVQPRMKGLVFSEKK